MKTNELTAVEKTALHYWSMHMEVQTGYDSIATVGSMYERTDGGVICCCFPKCEVRKRDELDMWRHVHFSRNHGWPPSFGMMFPLAVETAVAWVAAGCPEDAA